jgi:hypothetical protein
MDYSQRAAYRQWWRDLPGIVHEVSGLYLAQHAVDAVERQAETIRSMFSGSGRTHSAERLVGFRDAVHRAINRAALASAGLDPADRADAGLRTGLITLRTQATVDDIAWRSGLAAVAPDIVPPRGPHDRNGRHIPALLGLPGADPRALLHAAATEAMIGRLAAGPDGPSDPADVFEALHAADDGWDAAARFAGASERPGEVALVAEAMRGRYANVDNINLTRKPFERGSSRSQVSHYEGEVRKAQQLGRWAVSTGQATVADLAEQAAQAQVRPQRGQAVLDPRAGLVDPNAEAPASPPAGQTTYGQGREQVERGR